MKHQQKFYTTNQILNNENFRKFREIREHLTCQRLTKVSLITLITRNMESKGFLFKISNYFVRFRNNAATTEHFAI